ncbi:hypothetical protein EV121DRAFT_206973, partial [Schizophyllum commune]
PDLTICPYPVLRFYPPPLILTLTLPSCAALPLIDIPRLPPHAYPTSYDAARGRLY